MFENVAANYLEAEGYEIIARNYQAGHKEIDLIIKKENEIIFVEVKSAANLKFGHPAERVDEKKKNNLIKAAHYFIEEHNIIDYDLRFDVITFLDGKIEHYPNAFEATE